LHPAASPAGERKGAADRRHGSGRQAVTIGPERIEARPQNRRAAGSAVVRSVQVRRRSAAPTLLRMSATSPRLPLWVRLLFPKPRDDAKSHLVDAAARGSSKTVVVEESGAGASESRPGERAWCRPGKGLAPGRSAGRVGRRRRSRRMRGTALPSAPVAHHEWRRRCRLGRPGPMVRAGRRRRPGMPALRRNRAAQRSSARRRAGDHRDGPPQFSGPECRGRIASWIFPVDQQHLRRRALGGTSAPAA